jgi:membrane protease subunit (stomatin/prohibitin family)
MAILDLIEYPNEGSNEIVHRIPEGTSGEFRLGSQLVVRESQRAVFFRDGKALDTFGPGRHTISTNNIPLLTGLIGLPFGGDSPFRAEVYFVSMREFTDMKWGSTQPIVFRDTELGMIRLRAFGTYSMRVRDPQVLVNQVVGSRGAYTTASIEDFLRSVILTEFTDLLADVQTSILDLAKMAKEVGDATRAALADDFARLGFELTSFQVQAITPPEEVQKRIDERSGMAALGDMRTYTQFQTAQAIRDAAQNPGSGGDATSAGMGMGAGLGMGAAMAGAIRDAFGNPIPQGGQGGQGGQQQPQGSQGATGATTMTCPNCKASTPAGSKFCPECGTNLQQVICPKCQTPNQPGSKFCTNCGEKLA